MKSIILFVFIFIVNSLTAQIETGIYKDYCNLDHQKFKCFLILNNEKGKFEYHEMHTGFPKEIKGKGDFKIINDSIYFFFSNAFPNKQVYLNTICSYSINDTMIKVNIDFFNYMQTHFSEILFIMNENKEIIDSCVLLNQKDVVTLPINTSFYIYKKNKYINPEWGEYMSPLFSGYTNYDIEIGLSNLDPIIIKDTVFKYRIEKITKSNNFYLYDFVGQSQKWYDNQKSKRCLFKKEDLPFIYKLD